ncbi:1d72c806-d70f-42e9-a751-864abc66d649 [Sclerotinia trifoliorum]|uniref:1d72c806-d70f-42e9-a751-864abc66d649 n=1 Tax=Sclerotinia trifoliorum TaxID=28548 RepID=A0A8H2VKN0_9HELO|nr:1d72c806-d70f-42e9-a751-864abc66d649 [Sclerotinia trifoliorum]
MEDPATASWDVNISDADFEKLKAGFEAADMNHRWEIAAKDTDENGIIPIHISRSWTEEDQYILSATPIDGGAKIISITWEQNRGEVRIGEDYAKKEAVIVCRMMLRCDFDALPFYDKKALWHQLYAGGGTE